MATNIGNTGEQIFYHRARRFHKVDDKTNDINSVNWGLANWPRIIKGENTMDELNTTTNETLDTESAGNNQEQETKTYTQEEVLKLLQSEADKRVNQALAKQKKEYEKKLSLYPIYEEGC